jgi:hypothetical protein
MENGHHHPGPGVHTGPQAGGAKAAERVVLVNGAGRRFQQYAMPCSSSPKTEVHIYHANPGETLIFAAKLIEERTRNGDKATSEPFDNGRFTWDGSASYLPARLIFTRLEDDVKNGQSVTATDHVPSTTRELPIVERRGAVPSRRVQCAHDPAALANATSNKSSKRTVKQSHIVVQEYEDPTACYRSPEVSRRSQAGALETNLSGNSTILHDLGGSVRVLTAIVHDNDLVVFV